MDIFFFIKFANNCSSITRHFSFLSVNPLSQQGNHVILRDKCNLFPSKLFVVWNSQLQFIGPFQQSLSLFFRSALAREVAWKLSRHSLYHQLMVYVIHVVQIYIMFQISLQLSTWINSTINTIFVWNCHLLKMTTSIYNTMNREIQKPYTNLLLHTRVKLLNDLSLLVYN